MKLEKIKLHNFRCFEALELDLHERLTVIVSENGGGKTALLDAIAIGLGPFISYFNSAEQRLLTPGFQDRDFQRVTLKNGTAIKPWVAIEVMATHNRNLIPWQIWKGARKDENLKDPLALFSKACLHDFCRKIRENVDRYKHDGTLDHMDVSQSPFQLPAIAYYGTHRAAIEAMPKQRRDSKINYESPYSAYIRALNSRLDFKDFIRWFDITESDVLRHKNGQTEGLNERADTELNTAKEAFSSMFEKATPFQSTPYIKTRPLDFAVKNQDGLELSFMQLSDGQRSIALMALDYGRRLALASRQIRGSCRHAPGIMLIDEVDLHLHPNWQQRIIPDLMRTFPNTQFIVTTHSPQVLTTVPKECIRVISCTDGIGKAEIPQDQSKGVASSTVLACIMNTSPIPENDESRWVSDYRYCIELNQWESPDAISLRQKIADHFGPQSQQIRDCDQLIRMRQFIISRKGGA